MKKIDSISEKYHKFLLKIRFRKNDYFTVSGADATDNDNDKLIVDRNKKLLLFSEPAALFKAVLNTDHFFDIQLLHQWAKESASITKPYAKISIDILSRRDIRAKNVNLLFETYITLGIIGDYAIQVNHPELRSLLDSAIVEEHLDIFADYFLWSPGKEFTFTTLPAAFSDTVNSIYKIMENCIAIDPIDQW